LRTLDPQEIGANQAKNRSLQVLSSILRMVEKATMSCSVFSVLAFLSLCIAIDKLENGLTHPFISVNF
jgi:hypothetical protein